MQLAVKLNTPNPHSYHAHHLDALLSVADPRYAIRGLVEILGGRLGHRDEPYLTLMPSGFARVLRRAYRFDGRPRDALQIPSGGYSDAAERLAPPKALSRFPTPTLQPSKYNGHALFERP